VGLVHGLAGSAALALLVLAAIQTPLQGVAYLAVFGAGTICGMMAVTAAIAAPTIVATQRVAAMRRYVRAGAGALSLAFGLLLAHDVGVRHQLFGAAPAWIPE